MPKHYSMTRNSPLKIEFTKDGKKKSMKLPEPIMKPKSMLSKRQKDLMKTHSAHHTKPHLDMMKDLMKKGYCFEQAHEIAQKVKGK
jgi:phosphoribosylaminoimidazole-succinocarboxamide synthase